MTDSWPTDAMRTSSPSGSRRSIGGTPSGPQLRCPGRPRLSLRRARGVRRGLLRPTGRTGPRTADRDRSPAAPAQVLHGDETGLILAGGEERVDRGCRGEAGLPGVDDFIERGEGEGPARSLERGGPLLL